MGNILQELSNKPAQVYHTPSLRILFLLSLIDKTQRLKTNKLKLPIRRKYEAHIDEISAGKHRGNARTLSLLPVKVNAKPHYRCLP